MFNNKNKSYSWEYYITKMKEEEEEEEELNFENVLNNYGGGGGCSRISLVDDGFYNYHEEEEDDEEEEDLNGLNNETTPVQEDDDDEEIVQQVFPSHDSLSEHLRKSMYYGGLELPYRDRPSLAMTELMVEQLSDIKGQAKSLDRLSMEEASEVSVKACASPTSFLLALVYIERLKSENPQYLHKVSSTDLFLVSMMVASKFLNDDGEEDEVFNDEWANSAGIDKRDLNALEIEFLDAIGWRIYVDPQTFTDIQQRVELRIAMKQVKNRNWASYTDLLILTHHRNWSTYYLYSMKLALLGLSAYVTSIVTLLGTCYILNKTPLAPSSLLANFHHQSRLSSPASSSSTSNNATSSSSSDPLIDYSATSIRSHQNSMKFLMESIDSSDFDDIVQVPDENDEYSNINDCKNLDLFNLNLFAHNKTINLEDYAYDWNYDINKWKSSCRRKPLDYSSLLNFRQKFIST